MHRRAWVDFLPKPNKFRSKLSGNPALTPDVTRPSSLWPGDYLRVILLFISVMTKCLIGSNFSGEGFVLADSHHGSGRGCQSHCIGSLEPKHEQEVGPGYRKPLLPKGYHTKQELVCCCAQTHELWETFHIQATIFSMRKKMANFCHIVIWCGNMIRHFMYCLECSGGYSTSVLCLLWWQWVVHLWTSQTSLIVEFDL